MMDNMWDVASYHRFCNVPELGDEIKKSTEESAALGFFC